LFDIAADPDERNNLLLSPNPTVENKAAVLRRFLGEWGNSARPLPSQFEKKQFEETVRRLKALGYLR
jgi:hypothetical protein